MIINCFKTAWYRNVIRTSSSTQDRTFWDSGKRKKTADKFAKSIISDALPSPECTSSVLNINRYPISVITVKDVYSIKF